MVLLVLKKSSRFFVFRWLFMLGLLLLGGCTSLTSLFFFPQKVWISTPEDFELTYQDVWLTAADETQVHGWWIPAQTDTADTMVLYLHGNAENISSHSMSMYWLARENIDLFALDYRGFGVSEGKAMLPEVFQDIEAAAVWLRQQYPQKKLVIVAQSIGTALAVNFVAKAAETYQIDGLVLDAPFTGYGAVARSALSSNIIGWLVWPFTVLLPRQWDPMQSASQITLPLLVMHSQQDRVVPYKQGKKLFKAIANNNPRACWLESSGAHIESFLNTKLRAATLSFIKTLECPVEQAINP